MSQGSDTISAIATPAGKGGVSIVRVSGPLARGIAESILGFMPKPRYAHYAPFHDTDGNVIDSGITLFFPGPHSFTGEDVVEFQAHGGPFVIDRMLGETLSHGARIARPGEFSERAFLNDKIDLAQAEAIADLIESNSEQASRYALRSLQGEFSNLIHRLVDAITELRIYVEAAIDFPEEEIDFLSSGNVRDRLSAIRDDLDGVLAQARQGSIMKEGIKVVIAGEPNAGKSSLLNVLAGQTAAIVTEVAGTTRDTLREHIDIDGVPLHVIDTAGLRISDDIVEREGIRRAWDEVRGADRILLLQDASQPADLRENPLWAELNENLPDLGNVTLVQNKIDLIGREPQSESDRNTGMVTIWLSAKERAGIDLLREHLKQQAGFSSSEEGGFIARRRHLDALKRARSYLESAHAQLSGARAGELLAEDLRAAQLSLSEITGEFTSDDLLGEIFSSFCIGK